MATHAEARRTTNIGAPLRQLRFGVRQPRRGCTSRGERPAGQAGQLLSIHQPRQAGSPIQAALDAYPADWTIPEHVIALIPTAGRTERGTLRE
jgi:hypothetical protein